MKRTATMIALLASAGLLAACSEREASDAIDRTQDAVVETANQMEASTLGANRVASYIPEVVRGDAYEIAAANIALERSKHEGVRALAQAIHDEDTAASARFATTAATAAPDVTIPTDVGSRRQSLLDNLRAASDADFDKVYVGQQIAAHEAARTLHRGFADDSDRPALAEYARSVLPQIEARLTRAEALHAELGE